MPQIRVVRCPSCGSTDAASDESSSYADLSHMTCGSCEFDEYCDTWEVGFNWNVTIDLDVGAPLPLFLPPLAPGNGAHDKEPSPATRGPPTRAALGCTLCLNDNATVAWEASGQQEHGALIEESHFSVRVAGCACGTAFVQVFCERVDWGGGDDDQTWLRVPVSGAAEAGARAAIAARGDAGLSSLLSRMARHQRFLVRSDGQSWWRESGFTIPPHD